MRNVLDFQVRFVAFHKAERGYRIRADSQSRRNGARDCYIAKAYPGNTGDHFAGSVQP